VLTTERGWLRAVITTVTGMVGCATDGAGGWSSATPSRENVRKKPGTATTASSSATAMGHVTAAASAGAIAIDPIVATTSQSPAPRSARPNLPWIVM